MYTDVKNAVNASFKELRKAGWVARQSFWCCGTCASYDLSQDPKANGKPSVFYTKQDTADLRDRGFVYLAWGRVNGDLDVADAQVLVDTLKAHGLNVEWNGSVNQKVLVDGMAKLAPVQEATYLDLYADA